MDETVWIARVSTLAEGIPVAAQVAGMELVVLKCKGTIAVFQGVCPHQGTLLAGGSVDNGVLVCSGHGWRFDCDSGQKADDPSVCL
ncbi:MAG: Rieske (2Fe-2S) protein, partial [Roseiflexaceae bacterium]